ncbi:MAG TPA: arginine--tRNA ligase [Polyangiaceae bacterium]|nr:arginine--tRNA ligase [Polyangiaceae bacterium]
MTDVVKSPQQELAERFQQAVSSAFGPEHAGVDPLVRRSDRADFQANLAMSLGKSLKRPPRDVAQALIAALKAEDICEKVEIAGPGFINLTLKNDYLDRLLAQTLRDPRLGVGTTAQPDTVVVDYGGPNVAKEMHVGHLRPCVIGDCLVRVLEFSGHRVIRQNHIGDWGTPFGMLIEHLLDLGGTENAAELSVGELDVFYKAARKKFDDDPSFAERSRHRVVLLQGGDATTLSLWRALVDASKLHFEKVFARLGVTMTPADTRGESFYNAFLSEIAGDLETRGVASIQEGALCVFPDGFKNREGAPLPVIVRKSDGGFGYAATDLAALRYRAQELRGTRILYVVGSPQAQHFAMVFAVARMAGYVPDSVRTEHVGFGSILGSDRKMMKTRSGDTLRLIELLDEGRHRALSILEQRGVDMSAEAKEQLAVSLSLAAIKYADLSSDRIKDYVFDWYRMLEPEGNTGPYLQYAQARRRSLLRKLAAGETVDPGAIRIQHERERTLALLLVRFGEAVESVAATLEPHKLSSYLYELASAFASFWADDACAILREGVPPEMRASRIALTDLTGRVLMQGMALLGVDAPERM